mmetsp:Transcript_50889/g.140855  ORF Transcript_50889/g.140855 Transcript_50889/m.140855 type:complete len:282 (+) Transcript_50889:11-856(+)
MLLVSVAVGAFNVGMGPRAEVAHRAPRVVAVEPSAAIDMASLDPTVLGGAAAVVLGGAALAFSNKGDSAPAPAPAPPAPAPAPSPVVSTPVVYVPVGGTAGPHRMAGTMPPPPVRELWTPPPGWKPPTPPVSSWYDSGKRLIPPPAPTPPPPATPPKPASMFDDMMKGFNDFVAGLQGEPAAQPTVWPEMGGKAGPHRGAGTMPPPPARELWEPPPGWKPPSPPAKVVVASWYDTGMRLTGSVVPTGDAYAAKKAAYDARRLVLLPPTGANKPKQEKAAAK